MSEGPGLDVERLARALETSDLIRRYDEYSRVAYPDIRPIPTPELARLWANAVAAEYARLATSSETRTVTE